MSPQEPDNTFMTNELTPEVGEGTRSNIFDVENGVAQLWHLGPSFADRTTCIATLKKTNNTDLKRIEVPVANETSGSGTKSDTKHESVLQDMSQNVTPLRRPHVRQDTLTQAATTASTVGKRPRSGSSSGSNEKGEEGDDENRPPRSDRGANNKRRRLSTPHIPVPALHFPPSSGVVNPFTFKSSAYPHPRSPVRLSAPELFNGHLDSHDSSVASPSNANHSDHSQSHQTYTRGQTSWHEEFFESLVSDRPAPTPWQEKPRTSLASDRHSAIPCQWAEEFTRFIAYDKRPLSHHRDSSTGRSDDNKDAEVPWAEEFIRFIASNKPPPSHRSSSTGADDSHDFNSDCLSSCSPDRSGTDSEWTPSRTQSPSSSLSYAPQFEPYNPAYSYPAHFELRYCSDDDGRYSASSSFRESNDEVFYEDTEGFTTDCRDVEDHHSDSDSDNRTDADDTGHNSSYYKQQDEQEFGSSGSEDTADEETRYAPAQTSTPVPLSSYLRSEYRSPDPHRHDDTPLLYPNHWRLHFDPRDSLWQSEIKVEESGVEERGAYYDRGSFLV